MNAEQTHTTFEEEDTIDLLALLLVFKQKLWLILLAAVAVGGIFFAYSKFLLVPQYTSSAMIYILSKETTLTSLADLQIGTQLSDDYKVIIKTRPLLQEVIDQLGLEIDYKELKKKIDITDESDRILKLTVTDEDPMLAMQIVNQVAYTASDYIGDIMEMIPPKVIEDGELSEKQVSPNSRKNALLGALIGAVIVCGIITAGFLLNDTVKTEEDVEKYMGLAVLASVPNRNGRKKDGNNKKPRTGILKKLSRKNGSTDEVKTKKGKANKKKGTK